METPKRTSKEANLLPPWKKGDPSPNPNGRPSGQRNYATIYREALRKIAESQNKTPEELEELLLQSGLKNALKGDYRFYQDVIDRIHGKSSQPVDFTSNGETIQGIAVTFVRPDGQT